MVEDSAAIGGAHLWFPGGGAGPADRPRGAAEGTIVFQVDGFVGGFSVNGNQIQIGLNNPVSAAFRNPAHLTYWVALS